MDFLNFKQSKPEARRICTTRRVSRARAACARVRDEPRWSQRDGGPFSAATDPAHAHQVRAPSLPRAGFDARLCFAAMAAAAAANRPPSRPGKSCPCLTRAHAGLGGEGRGRTFEGFQTRVASEVFHNLKVIRLRRSLSKVKVYNSRSHRGGQSETTVKLNY